jgi:REP element-mobilizing transposase RayT
MSRLVLGYHLILTAYGFWLPNDPRGSWSDFVRSWELLRFGPATKVTHRRSVARRSHDRALRLEAKRALVRRPVEFDGVQARAVGRGFGDYCRRSGLVVHACSNLPTHVHLVIARDPVDLRQIARLLKGAATTALNKEGLHPFADQPFRNRLLPTPWTRHEWNCFLFSTSDVTRAIQYVERNPVKEGKGLQSWNFIRPFDPNL